MLSKKHYQEIAKIINKADEYCAYSPLKEAIVDGLCEYFKQDNPGRRTIMGKPHKHADLIKAWADGYAIEYREGQGKWVDIVSPAWDPYYEYRIKPETKPDKDVYFLVNSLNSILSHKNRIHNLKLTFDGETGKLKAAEVI